MTERMYGGYPESCIREGLFQLEGEQVMEITRDLLAENAALREAAANAVLAWRREDDDALTIAMDALSFMVPGDNTPELPSQGGGEYYAIALHPDGTSTDLKKPYCRDCGSNDVSMECHSQEPK